MKSEFNTNWNKSKQPRKQRKYLANAPNHLKGKFLSANLDKPLRAKLGRRSLEVRKNDEVKVMRGKYTKKSGKVLLVDRDNARVQIDGLNVGKKDGEKVPVWFHASNIKITKLDDSDKKRVASARKNASSEDKKKSSRGTSKASVTKETKSENKEK